MSPSRRRPVLLVPVCAVLANALALSDFSPSLENVPDPCSSVYMNEIVGCTANDFPDHCSSFCIAGLVQINSDINNACTSFFAPEGSLISLFQNGKGIQALCNIVVVTAPSGATATISSSTMVPTSSCSSTSSPLVDTSTSSAPARSTAGTTTTSSSTSTSPTSFSTTTSKSSTSSSASTSSQTLPAPTPGRPGNGQGGNGQGGNAQSGNGGSGGDPFAISTNSGSLASIVSLKWFGAAIALVALAGLTT